MPLHLFEERYRRMIVDVLATDREFGVVLIRRGSEVGGGDQRCDVGTRARVLEEGRLPTDAGP
jgi:Lon protease-like protein